MRGGHEGIRRFPSGSHAKSAPARSPRITFATMTGPKEYGVFLPLANGGWVVRRTPPPLDGGWVQNRDAALAAEEQGFDFVMAMGKWRGFGGATSHWGSSLEAATMMAGIA